jgi:hypothetical protein
MKASFPALSADRSAVWRITESAERQLLKLLFCRYPHREWGTFFRFGHRRTPWGLALSFADTLPPGPDDLDRESGIVEFRPEYIRRALRAQESGDIAVGVIHSHPLGSGTSPSWLDDDMDNYYAELFPPYGENRPYLSLIVARDQSGRLRMSGRVFDRGEWLPLRTWFSVGLHRVDRIDATAPSDYTEKGESTVARLETLVGTAGTRRLRRSRVAVLGCSGSGSPAIEMLARAGVGGFVLVDFQDFGRSNLERMHGSTREHAESVTPVPKVIILEELVHAIDPSISVTPIAGNLLDEEVLDEILDCDLVLNCTDSEHSRASLGDLAVHYLIPVLDVAVLLEGKDGRVSAQIIEFIQYLPGLPCAFCDKRIDPRRLAHELMSEKEREVRRRAASAAAEKGLDANQYWAGEPVQILTVGHLTTAAGSMLAGHAIGFLTGSSMPPASRFQVDLLSSGFGYVAPLRKASPHCACRIPMGWADQSRADRSVSRPSHWPKPRFFLST